MSTPVIVEIEGPCRYDGCNEPATQIAVGRANRGHPGHPVMAVYCDTHAEVVADEGSPEYREHCPNCGCQFGVN